MTRPLSSKDIRRPTPDAMVQLIKQLKQMPPYRFARAGRRRLARLRYEGGLQSTADWVTFEKLGLENPDHVSYEPSGWVFLRRALQGRRITGADVFVDIGSGKGRVVWQAARYPFGRVVGVEISKRLNDFARRNIESNLHRLKCKNVELVNCDATDYELPDDVSYVYMYNPFTGHTFARVLDGIVASLDRRPRSLTLIYAHPVAADAVESTGRFRLRKVIKSLRPEVRADPRMWVNVYESLPAPKRQATGDLGAPSTSAHAYAGRSAPPA
jgi:hypothetical protein